jgi:DNA uptake protein ComE-like DNA-binding protein
VKKTIFMGMALASLACFSDRTAAQTPPPQEVSTPQSVKGDTASNFKNGLLNINKATHGQLTALGLSDAAADRVIQKRPFRKKHELVSYQALTQEEFLMIKDKVYTWWPMRAMVTR